MAKRKARSKRKCGDEAISCGKSGIRVRKVPRMPRVRVVTEDGRPDTGWKEFDVVRGVAPPPRPPKV